MTFEHLLTRLKQGPHFFTVIPELHLLFPEYSLIHTGSFTLKVCASSPFCLSSISFDTAASGKSKLSLVVISLMRLEFFLY